MLEGSGEANPRSGGVRMIKTLVVFGTRPEAIKLAPVIIEMRRQGGDFETVVCVTAQHREMLDHVLSVFDIKVDYDLKLMRRRQSLAALTSRLALALQRVISQVGPDLVLVQGDTTTTMVSSLIAFYNKVMLAHVEAGLRTYDKYAPYPEELNRKITTDLADIHFSPTETARDNLLNEGVSPAAVFVTGNTAIDALILASKMPVSRRCRSILGKVAPGRRMILVTGHRRESFGVPFENIFSAIASIVERNPDVEVVFPVHLNPKVSGMARNILGRNERVHLIGPVDYGVMVHLMKACHLILTDSGGIQEEAPALGKPVLVLRDVTERPELLAAGAGKLVGTAPRGIILKCQAVLDNRGGVYDRMAAADNPYGDGRAARRIVRILRKQAVKGRQSA